MKKKILIAVDASPSTQRAVDYVGLMEGARIAELNVTLFHVMPGVPDFLRREAQADPQAYRRLRALEDRNHQEAHRVLLKARERLLGHGLQEEQVEVKALPRLADAAHDILFEAERGLYDAVVLGRRGLTKTQELFAGSVTHQVVQHAQRTPVWVVGGRVSSLKVLCAVDGSEGSLKAVDHMAFMLGGNPECRVTIFHVGASFKNYCPVDFGPEALAGLQEDLKRSDERCMKDFLVQARQALQEGGLEPDQVDYLSRDSALSVSGAVLEAARAGDYGSVVLGRSGQERAKFLGHVSDKVMAAGEDLAVWVVG
ncbi:MAG: universal stress protein [Desulfarculus sp.]|nr:universal stress protein [Desulfarculus sp.]